MSSMDGRGLGAIDWTEMELKKRAYPVVTLDSAALQGRIAVESGDSAPIAGCSGPVPMVWAPRAARGGLARAVYTRRAHQCERSRSRLVAPIPGYRIEVHAAKAVSSPLSPTAMAV